MATTKRTRTPAARTTKAVAAPARGTRGRAPATADEPAPRARARARAEASDAPQAPTRARAGKKAASTTAEPAAKPRARARTGAGAAVTAVTAAPPAPPAPQAKDADELLAVGRAILGIRDYRAGQREALEHLLAGKDVIAVMPTGSGKSLLYQLPSLVLPGLTVVVSPLIALIKDQVDKMVAKGVAVVRIDSTLTVRQRREMDALAQAPGGKLLLTTPERMADPEFRAFLRACSADVGVSRFVVDEAHCVSQWGHDFRPSYLSLRKALEDVGRPPVLATTATAPPHVRLDIKEQLGIEDAEIVTTTFDRPNLHYEVINFPGEDEKMKTLVTLLKKLPRPGIVYCATVKKVEELYEALGRHGIPVARYHGRMTKNERDAEQERFMEAKDLVMLATNAFGLGVDKKDIRNVLHYHVPGSLEAYAQEAGRGGRDGKPTRCVLLFSPDDVAIQEYFLSGTYPTRRQVRAVYDALEAYVDAARGPLREDTAINVANVALASGVGQQRTRTVLSLLKDEGFIVERDGGVYDLADPPLPEELLNDKARQYEARRIMDRQRLDALLAYVKAPGCRNKAILAYLGEPAWESRPDCGRCDNCLRSREAALAAATEATQLGARVIRVLDEESAVEVKPRKVIRHRVVRIDQPAPAEAAAPPTAAPASPPPPPAARSATGAAPGTRRAPATPTATPAPAAAPPAPMVRTRAKASPPAAPAPAPVAPPAPAVRRRGERPAPTASAASADPPAPPSSTGPAPRRAPGGAADAATAAAQPGSAIPPAVRRTAPAKARPEGDDEDEDDDDLEDDDDDDDDDDDLDDDELAGDDEDDDDLEDDEDEDDEDEDEDEDDLDDDDLDDDDLDDEDDLDDDDLDDDDDEDDDIEVIDRTAAELAEEGVEVDGEITVLARKRQPKAPKTRAPRPDLSPDQSAAAEARRRRRRRRRKRRAMLPPKSAFTTPVLSTSAPAEALPPAVRARQGGGGPVIEYVRGPMRIASAPVASAAPSDTGAPRKGSKRRHRGSGGWSGEGRGDRPLSAAERRAERRAERLEKKKRRRRRRKRNLAAGLPADGPVSFFQPVGGARALPPAGNGPGGPRPGGNGPNGQAGPPGPPGPDGAVQLGPDGQPLPRKRRRRRRRGRGGRGRPDQRAGAGGPAPDGAAPAALPAGAAEPPSRDAPPRDE